MRETGAVRKQLSGEEAAPYMGFARTLLGALKTRMTLGGLQQGLLTRQLEDGTVVQVRSLFGQDTVTISAPVPQVGELPTVQLPQEARVPDTPLEESYPQEPVSPSPLVMCGAYIYNNIGHRPCIFHPSTGITDLGGGFGYAEAISDDGAMVAGTTADGPYTDAMVWTPALGAQVIGRTGTGAYSVSRDHIVVGQDGGDLISNARPATAFMWTRDNGFQLIAASAGVMYSGATQIRPRISANGRYVCWAYKNPSTGATGAQVLLMRTGAVVTAPPNADGWGYAVGVADTGDVIIFSGTPYIWNCLTNATTPVPMYQPYAISADGSVVTGVDNDGNGVIWTAEHGVQGVTNTAVWGVSRDGRVLGGSINLGDRKDTAAYWHRSAAGFALSTIPSAYGGEIRGVAIGNPPIVGLAPT